MTTKEEIMKLCEMCKIDEKGKEILLRNPSKVLINPTEKQNSEDVIPYLKNKKFVLKKWKVPKENPNWDHDHCEICFQRISNSNYSDEEREAFADEKEEDWICRKCFNKYLENLR